MGLGGTVSGRSASTHAARIAAMVKRSLIVDPNAAAARLIVDLLRGLGGSEIVVEPDEKLALLACMDLEPGIIFVEHSGPRLSGESFARRLRWSNLECRKAPIIMVTGEATASTIKGARDAGVHEFIRKPFSSGDVLKRVEMVATRERDWIEAVGYVGPDRRRFNSADYSGPLKRRSDVAARTSPAAAKEQALRILVSSVQQFDTDPAQALRSIRAQAASLRQLAATLNDGGLADSLKALDAALASPEPSSSQLRMAIRGLEPARGNGSAGGEHPG
jgi:CheY-like chemotaxis protein